MIEADIQIQDLFQTRNKIPVKDSDSIPTLDGDFVLDSGHTSAARITFPEFFNPAFTNLYEVTGEQSVHTVINLNKLSNSDFIHNQQLMSVLFTESLHQINNDIQTVLQTMGNKSYSAEHVNKYHKAWGLYETQKKSILSFIATMKGNQSDLESVYPSVADIESVIERWDSRIMPS